MLALFLFFSGLFCFDSILIFLCFSFMFTFFVIILLLFFVFSSFPFGFFVDSFLNSSFCFDFSLSHQLPLFSFSSKIGTLSHSIFCLLCLCVLLSLLYHLHPALDYFLFSVSSSSSCSFLFVSFSQLSFLRVLRLLSSTHLHPPVLPPDCSLSHSSAAIFVCFSIAFASIIFLFDMAFR